MQKRKWISWAKSPSFQKTGLKLRLMLMSHNRSMIWLNLMKERLSKKRKQMRRIPSFKMNSLSRKKKEALSLRASAMQLQLLRV